MKKLKFVNLLVIFLVFLLGTGLNVKSYAFEIYDLNGTWQPDESYKYMLKATEEEKKEYIKNYKYSWGKGKYISYRTFNVDLTAKEPFVIEPGLGQFPVKILKNLIIQYK